MTAMIQTPSDAELETAKQSYRLSNRPKIEARDVNVFYGEKHALKNVNLDMNEREVMALIGPSGCGKTTFLKTLNRLIELIPTARVTGSITLDGDDVYDKDLDVSHLRRRFGIVAQKPDPFPFSIRHNVAYAPRLHGRVWKKEDVDELVETTLKRVHLWDEVKDIMSQPGTSLSGGQQQRLCIARALAYNPEVLLMDEPCSALDPVSTGHVEDLIAELRKDVTIVIVTHNMEQAARVAQRAAFFHLGEMLESGPSETIFNHPSHELTRAFVEGRFG